MEDILKLFCRRQLFGGGVFLVECFLVETPICKEVLFDGGAYLQGSAFWWWRLFARKCFSAEALTCMKFFLVKALI